LGESGLKPNWLHASRYEDPDAGDVCALSAFRSIAPAAVNGSTFSKSLRLKLILFLLAFRT
jgi:hypothetical protein